MIPYSRGNRRIARELGPQCGWKCEICGRQMLDTAENGFDFTRANKCLVVDHHHGTGWVRGMLCQGCNAGLGAFRDRLESLKAAVQYIERAQAKQVEWEKATDAKPIDTRKDWEKWLDPNSDEALNEHWD